MTNNEKSWYISGFADGEGSFNCSWRKRDDFLIGWKLSPVFNISQKDSTLLNLIKAYFHCGTVRFRKDGVWGYQVDNQKALVDIIIPFFQKHFFLSEKKKRDFARFQKIVDIVYGNNKSKTYQDITLVLHLVADVEVAHARKYTDQEILDRAADFWGSNKEKIKARNLLTIGSGKKRGKPRVDSAKR